MKYLLTKIHRPVATLSIAVMLACALVASPSEAQPAQGGQLVIGTTDIVQFDPYRTNSRLHGYTFYDTLIEYDDDLNPRPSMAESWTMADDNLSIEIRLRDAMFHSGNTVTSADLVAGIDRALDRSIGFSLASSTAFVRDVDVIDARTVKVNFIAPTPLSLVEDWMFSFPIVEAEFNTPEYLESAEAGTGPFMLAEYTPGEMLTVVRFADYWADGRPYLDQIDFRFFDDSDSLVAALASGSVDGALNIPLRNIPQLDGEFESVFGPGVMDFLILNPKSEAFMNQQLRQSLMHAINRDRIIQQVQFGVGNPIYTTLMPSSPAFQDSILEDEARFDLDLASSIIADLPASPSGSCIIGSDPGYAQIAQIVQADLASIGYELQIEQLEQAVFIDRVTSGNFACAIAAQPSNLSSPSLASCCGPMRTGANNSIWGEDVPADYVEAIAANASAMTEAERQSAFDQFNEVMLRHAWMLGLVTRPSYNAFSPRVNDVPFSPRERPMFGYTHLSE